MFKNILVPIDMAHLAEGKSIVDIAIREAGDDGNIILLNVIEEIPNWAAINLPADLQEKSIAAAREELEVIKRGSQRRMTVEVLPGHASDTILEVAEKREADLIIVASHRPGLQDYFLGSTAARVVRHANCSVLVVR